MAEGGRELSRPRVVIVSGPTGVGKSRLAMELAETFGGEIVSADSMQVYRHLDIGTAKPTPEERGRVPHHLIDLVEPDEPFHAGFYRTLGRRTIHALHEIGKAVWVVGGTGLYIKSLTEGLFQSPEIDPSIRDRLKKDAEENGKEALYERLRAVDPITASRLHPNDLFRTIRALEVFEATGNSISAYRDRHRFEDRPYETLKIGLEMDRDLLYRRIDQRVDGMIERGLVDEVTGLLEMGYGPDLKPMQSLGYNQVILFLTGKMEKDEAIREIKRDTRHYAKRQWTWFKGDQEIRWYEETHDRGKIFSDVSSFWKRGG